jgi:pimeloyl-ACP methyl ester carboxylesterase
MTFKTKGGQLEGTIDIPEQNASGIVLKNVRFELPKLHCELPAGPGVAIFDGTLAGDSLAGAFTQSGITGKFYAVRGKAAPKVEEARETVPYAQEEVVFYDDSIKFAGTLTLPETKGPHPAVVMITGSGPQNRDEELFGFKPFKVIADHFTRKGIAVLRYDDRGVGGSTGNNGQSTTKDFAQDALAAIHFLQTRPDINPKQIGLCGHSEGGIVGPLAASQSADVAFVICIAGTGIDGEDLLLAQEKAIMRADSATDDEIEKAVATSRLVYQSLLSSKDTVELRQQLRKAVVEQIKSMTDVQRKAITNEDEFIKMGVEARLRSLGSPWFRYFLAYNPAPALEKVRCPVLALFGGHDTQVPAKLNEDAMESALKKGGNTDYTFKVFPNANHLFLAAKTGSPREYGALKKEFVPGFLDTMSDWILKRVTVVQR